MKQKTYYAQHFDKVADKWVNVRGGKRTYENAIRVAKEALIEDYARYCSTDCRYRIYDAETGTIKEYVGLNEADWAKVRERTKEIWG